MPMHYPPLADGSYRYGDQPQPLPSPVPGPDPFPPAGSPQGPQSQSQQALGPQSQGQPALGPQPPGQSQQPQGSPHGPAWQAAPPPHQLPPNSPPHAGPGILGDSPVPEAPTGKKRVNGPVAAVAVVGGLALVVVAVLGLGLLGTDSDRGATTDTLRGPSPQSGPLPERSPGAGTFTVDGTFTVVATPGEPVSGNSTGCDMPVSLSDIGEGTTLTLLESDTGRSVRSMLAYEGGDLSSCTFTFEFPDVSPGGALYMIELPGRGQLVYSEDELRAGVDISLGR